jgi:hypothetical protein
MAKNIIAMPKIPFEIRVLWKAFYLMENALIHGRFSFKALLKNDCL